MLLSMNFNKFEIYLTMLVNIQYIRQKDKQKPIFNGKWFRENLIDVYVRRKKKTEKIDVYKYVT